MDELIDHLNQERFFHLYGRKYNEIIRTLYILLRRALQDNATSIEISNVGIVRKVNSNIIGEFPLDFVPEGGRKHIDNMLLLLEKDYIVTKYVTASLEEDTLVCIINW